MRRTLLFGLLVGMAGCRALEQDPTLHRFSDCDEMREHMEGMARMSAKWWQSASKTMITTGTSV